MKAILNARHGLALGLLLSVSAGAAEFPQYDIELIDEQVAQSKLEFEIACKAKTSLKEIGDWGDVTVSFEADTGQTYVISHGWSTTPPPLTDNEGKAKITIEGPPAEEMV